MLRFKPASSRKGLTLIEVMVALGVMVILLGGIFLVVQTSLKTVLKIDTFASRADEITNLTDIFRSAFRNLPARARLTGQAIVSEDINQYLLIIRDAPGFLSWKSAPEAADTIVLISFRQDDESDAWRVCMKRLVPPKRFLGDALDPKTVLKIASDVPWLELVGDFQAFNIRFFDGKAKAWKNEWKITDVRPSLIEIKLVSEQKLDERSETMVIWVPPVRVKAV